MRIKSVFAGLSVCALFVGLVYMHAAASDISKPVWYIWQDTNATSSWEVNNIASQQSKVNTKEVMYAGLYNDTSEFLPVSANREIRPVYSGKLTLEFDFALDREMNGTGFRLLGGSATAFGIVTKNSGIYLELPGGDMEYLSAFASSRMIDSHTYSIKAIIDIDSNITEAVYVDGTLCAANKPFAEYTDRITSFDISTTKEAVGNVLVRYVKLYGGYDVYEMFMCGNGLPSDWEKTGTGNVGLRVFNYRYVDRNSLELDSGKGSVSYKKRIADVGGKVTFEAQLLLPQKRDGVEIALTNDNETVFSFRSGDKSFQYLSSGAYTDFYDYIGNLWYHFRAELDLNNHKADIYLNGKLKCENVSIENISHINGIGLSAAAGEYTAIFDDIILYRTPEMPDDYVPEPQKVSSDKYAIGMQMCPLWTEGTSTGWDCINASQGRKPLLGFYDEGDPEYADWAIKYMAEHGIDFWLPCMYTCYAIEEAERDPIKDNSFRHGYAIHNGYFNAKYSNAMAFSILWENGGYLTGRATEKDFFENLVPFWIEYYFKDPRYFRLNGRPVMSILNPSNFFSVFEGGARNDEAVLKGIQKFRNMCIEAGVGNPILMINTTAVNNTEADLERWNKMGFEGFSKYNYSIYGNLENTKNYLNTYKEINKKNSTLEIFPALCTGFNGVPWTSSSTGFEATPKEFEKFLWWVKDSYLPSLPKTKYERQVVIADTWDEFGEGTIICPTEKYGFGMLDAIRTVFIGDETHEDIIPNDTQKLRISNMYNPEREVSYTMEYCLDDIDSQVPIYSWDFSESLGDWTLGGGISDVRYENGAAVLKLNQTNPTLSLSDSDIDLYNINYIKVTMKLGASKGGYVRWTTNLDPNVTNRKYRVMSELGMANGEFTDYYIPIGENYLWKGVLGKLNFTLGQMYDTNEDIIIKGIEFLGSPEDKAEYRLKIDGYQTAIDAITDSSEDTLFDLNTIVSELGGKMAKIIKDDAAAIKLGENIIVIYNGSVHAEKNGKNIELESAPIVMNGKYYVSSKVLTSITGHGFNRDARNAVLECTTAGSSEDTGERAVLYEYLFATAEDIKGMTFNSHIGARSFSDGGLKMSIIGTDPYFRVPVDGIDASKVKRIEVGMSSGVSSTGKIYFTTDTATNFNEAKTISFAGSASKSTKSYILNCEANPYWNGTITQLRVDIVDNDAVGNWVNVEYIRLLGDIIETDDRMDMESCVDVTDYSYTWNFNKNTKFDGFAPSKHIADLEISGGELCFRPSGNSPMIQTRKGVSIDADKYTRLLVQLKNNTAGGYMKMYFYKNSDDVVDGNNGYEVELKPFDSAGTLYTADLSQNPEWAGNIKGLLLEFAGAQGDRGAIRIDSVSIETSQ